MANPRPARKAAERLAAAKWDLARTTKGSTPGRRAVDRVAAHHRKVVVCAPTTPTSLSRQLVDNYDLLAREDLRITHMVRSARGSVIERSVPAASSR